MREKLIELLAESEYMSFEKKADHLMAKGVTLQQYEKGFADGKEAAMADKILFYEEQIAKLKNVIESLRQAPVERFLFQDGKIIPLNRWEWIPITERLPEDYATVLAYDGSSVEPCLYFSKRGFWTYDQYESDYVYVTHWMPLPQPPK